MKNVVFMSDGFAAFLISNFDITVDSIKLDMRFPVAFFSLSSVSRCKVAFVCCCKSTDAIIVIRSSRLIKESGSRGTRLIFRWTLETQGIFGRWS